ncbi:hypothetical protein MFU01_23900 [Myxococcus fulvus]|uniref:Uncharacterized protein n=1 Tax=Myxococcus fulvus TaxID=33 RepID=A0A511T190_MYXFU|nr:hypothetical protein MFU01_23900 [Myxococcus fulvus]
MVVVHVPVDDAATEHAEGEEGGEQTQCHGVEGESGGPVVLDPGGVEAAT